MSFGDYILLGADILQIKPKAIGRAAADPEALKAGVIFVAAAGAAAALGSWTLPGLILFPLVYLVRVLIGTAAAHFLSTSGFGGTGEFIGLLRPVALSFLLDWILVVGLVVNIVPLLGPALMILLALMVTLWKLVVDTVIIETVYGLPRYKAVAVVGIVAALALAVLFLASLFGAAVMGSWLVTG
jgi:hypothetical protein